MKADPYGSGTEAPRKSAWVVRNLDRYEWKDSEWMDARAKIDYQRQPVSVYEVHLESWLRLPQGQVLSYRELADKLVAYTVYIRYTHFALPPLLHYPNIRSWRPQSTRPY